MSGNLMLHNSHSVCCARLVFAICNQTGSRPLCELLTRRVVFHREMECYCLRNESRSLRERLVSCHAWHSFVLTKAAQCSGSFPLNFSRSWAAFLHHEWVWTRSERQHTVADPRDMTRAEILYVIFICEDDFKRDILFSPPSECHSSRFASHIIASRQFSISPFQIFRLKLILNRVIEKLRNFPS